MGRKIGVVMVVAGCVLVGGILRAHETRTAENHEVLEQDGVTVVVDTKYNLMWERKSDDPEDAHYCERLFSWEEAAAFAEKLNETAYAGQADWRIPSAWEISTLVDVGRGKEALAIDTEAFPLTGEHLYWTGSIYEPWPPLVQFTGFLNGNQFKWSLKSKMRVRLVAGGGWLGRFIHAPPEGRDAYAQKFEIVPHEFSDGTVHETVLDHITGLEWEQKAWHGDEPPSLESAVAFQMQLLELLQIVPFAAEFLTTLLLDDFAASGFMDDQGPQMALDFLEIVSGIGGWLLRVYEDLAAEMAGLELEGHALLGPRSFLKLYDYTGAENYIAYLNDIGYAGANADEEETLWRLPTVEEIITITDWSRIPCAKEIFTPTFGWLFWTRTLDPPGEKHYWT